MKTEENEKEYSFIQEKIVPKTKNSRKKRVRSVITTVSLAVLFGFISSIVFSFSNYFIRKTTKDDRGMVKLEQGESSPMPEAAASPEVKEENASKNTESSLSDFKIAEVMDIRSYQKLFSMMTDINNDLKYSMVTVVAYQNITSWLELENADSSYGLIVADDDNTVYIMCTYTKIKGIDKIKIKFYNDDMLTASVTGYDKDTNLAILQVEKDKLAKRTGQKITKAVMGDSYQITTGTPVLALGSPNGYMYSMLIGYVTDPAVNKFIVDGKLEMYHTSIEEKEEGSGFFVNLSGQIIGVMTHDYRENSDKKIMSFLGVSRLRSIVEDIINNRERAYLGIEACELTSDEAKTFNVNYGIYVTDVIADSPAFNQGIKSGDVITEVDGKCISSVSALNSILRTHAPEDKIEFKITRQSKDEYPKISFPEQTLNIVLGKKPSTETKK